MRYKLLCLLSMMFSFSVVLALPENPPVHEPVNPPPVARGISQLGQAKAQEDQAKVQGDQDAAQKSAAAAQAAGAGEQSMQQGVQQTQELAQQLRQNATSVAGSMSQDLNATK